METPEDKQGVTNEVDAVEQPQTVNPIAPPVPQSWLVLLAVIVVLGALGMFLMRQAAASRWRK
jgi:cytoskeletal protein RodZ